jgi:Ca2+-binding EF-hand superfamily protein
MRMTLFLLLAALSAPAFAASPSAAMLGRMEGADANRDGIITKAELIAFRASNFVRLDRDGNGMLTRSDIPAFMARVNSGLDFNSLMQQFDANRDKKVSREEFVRGPTVLFDAADANGDGILTTAERKAAIAAAKR